MTLFGCIEVKWLGTKWGNARKLKREALALIKNKQVIGAIALYRQRTTASLQEARDTVLKWREEAGL